VWSFTQKLAGSLGGWVALTGLALIGFNATPGAANGADELFGLRGLFAVLPSIFYFSAAALMWHYPITEEKHAEMRTELRMKLAANGASAAS
jgi:Na+/melibiose symporter-like transporter